MHQSITRVADLRPQRDAGQRGFPVIGAGDKTCMKGFPRPVNTAIREEIAAEGARIFRGFVAVNIKAREVRLAVIPGIDRQEGNIPLFFRQEHYRHLLIAEIMQRRECGVSVTAGDTAQQCGAVFGHHRDFCPAHRFAGIHGLHKDITRAVGGGFRDDPHISDHHKARVENRILFVILIPFVIAFRFRGFRRFSRIPCPQAQQEYAAFCGRVG